MIIRSVPDFVDGRLDIPDAGARAKSFEGNSGSSASVRWRDQTRHHGTVFDDGNLFADAHALQPGKQVLAQFADVDFHGRRHGGEATVAGPWRAVKRNEWIDLRLAGSPEFDLAVANGARSMSAARI